MTQNTAIALSELQPGEHFHTSDDAVTKYEVLPNDPERVAHYTDRLTGEPRHLIRARFDWNGRESVLHLPNTEQVVRV
jgi:hypothetical protein